MSTEFSDARRVEDLPANLQSFIQFLETCLATPISAVSTGPARAQFLRRREP